MDASHDLDSLRQQEQWPDALDALVAAPKHHRLLFENERVRVVETRIPPGERTPVHTHRWGGVLYIVSWSHHIRYDDKGNVLLDTPKSGIVREAGWTNWSAPLPPHSLENVGTTELRIIGVEMKDN
jgi:hypothetical protein